MDNIKDKVKLSISNLREKKAKIYFFVQDTKGNPKASVRYIYQMAKSLLNSGFNPIILHEKNDYVGVSEWLNNEYMEIPHKAIENQNLEVAPEDFIIVPEIFGYVMEQIKQLPCAKIVLVQSYSYMMDTLQPGQSWANYGFYKCITTTEKQKEFIGKIMKQVTFDIIEPYISDCFQPKQVPPMPIIGVHTKEHNDTINIIKTFYLKYPQYRWFTFRDLRGISETEFAKSLRDCFLSVWIDDDSAFGTFPLESMASGVPIIGKIPNIQPSWMNEDNGIWVDNKIFIVDVIADFIQNWLEDAISDKFYESMEITVKPYLINDRFNEEVIKLFEKYLTQRADAFENQIEKTEE